MRYLANSGSHRSEHGLNLSAFDAEFQIVLFQYFPDGFQKFIPSERLRNEMNALVQDAPMGDHICRVA
jgi:hypothetical protein